MIVSLAQQKRRRVGPKVKQEFPRILYHPVQGQVTVNDTDEKATHLKQGWSESPVVYSRLQQIEAEMKFHRERFSALKLEREQILSEIPDPMEEPEPARVFHLEPNQVLCSVCGFEAKTPIALRGHMTKHMYEK